MNFRERKERSECLLEMVEKGRCTSTSQVADKFNCCSKTVKRSIDELIPIRSIDPPDLLAPRKVGTMTLFPHYFSEEVVASAGRRTQRPPRIVLRMFHPADGENSGASLGGSVLRNDISAFLLHSSLQYPPASAE